MKLSIHRNSKDFLLYKKIVYERNLANFVFKKEMRNVFAKGGDPTWRKKIEYTLKQVL